MPYILTKFGNELHRFQPDNDPIHMSKVSRKFMGDNQINWWDEWPVGTVYKLIQF